MIDKHRLLLVVGSADTKLVIVMTGSVDGVAHESLETPFAVESVFPLEDGSILTRMEELDRVDEPGLDLNMEPKFAFDVVLHEPGIVKTEPLVPTLHHFTGAVAEVIDVFAPLLRAAWPGHGAAVRRVCLPCYGSTLDYAG